MALADIFNGGRRAQTGGLSLRYFGDPVLAAKSRRIDGLSPELREFADEMIKAMYQHNGVGLAAPQVGRNIHLIVLDTHQTDDPLPPDAGLGERILTPLMPVALVNLEILDRRGDWATAEEGCLSFPEIYGPVTRRESVVFRAELLDGSTVQGDCNGLLARCLQHELDHINGIVFPERMTEEQRATIEKQLKALKKSTTKALAKSAR